LRLAQVVLFVKDIARMRAFYGGVLGLRPLDASDGLVRLDAGGTALALHAIPTHIPIDLADPPLARTETPIKLAFHVDDIEASRAMLVAAGVLMHDVHRFGAVAFCDGLDPEGNVFQLTTR
jgi:catechol 2,3-dioxygenase-like lactoylglutathione lyase family enzyme